MSDPLPDNKQNERSRPWLRRIVKLGILVAAVSVVAAISQMPSQKKEAAATEAPPINVTAMTVVAEAQLPDTFELPAVVEPNRIVSVAAEVAGAINRIPPKEGSLVQAGDVLVQLNTDLITPQVEIAKAQYDRDKIQYERISALVKTDAASRNDLDDTTTRLATSQAQLQEVQARLERTRIVAPITGVLNNLPMEEGEYVQPGVPVAEVVETNPVKVVVQVPERDIAFFATGQNAEILANIKGCDQTITGTITFISEVADPQTRSTRMEVTVANRDGTLRSGQIVRARLTRRVLANAVMVPLLAVIPLEEGYAVYVVESGQAQRREVTLGPIKGDRVQVTSGLNPGDRLIIAGHRFVAPGQKVNVVPQGRE
ncbi:MAG: efflux RND transporter periplasmic adaptor subunit [Sedimentisphaerales bacterium]|nr:efflux RND transporter periplasmic adaptor subunit [Sedimentisphaerales bacterium]